MTHLTNTLRYLLLISTFSAITCHARDGDIDRTFADQGWISEFVASPGHKPAIAIEPDGHIVVVTAAAATAPSINGHALQTDQILLFRFDKKGIRDTLFGENGIVRLPYRAQSDDRLALLILPNQKIIVGGFVGNEPGAHVLRLHASGALDASFGVNGLVTLDKVNGGHLGDIAVQPDGKLLVSYMNPNTYFARLERDGQLDINFGNNGLVNLTTSVHSNDRVKKILVLGNHHIVIVGDMYQPDGNNSFDFGVWKLMRDGSFDTTFADIGYRRYSVEGRIERAGSALIDAHGRIVIAGGSSLPDNHDERFALLRVLPNGNADTSFGSNGILYNEFSVGTRFYSVIDAFQPNGKFLTMGLTFIMDGLGNNYGMLLHRYNDDGTLDTDFANAGTAIYDYSSKQDLPQAMALTPHGDAIIVGFQESAVTNYPGELATVYLQDLLVTQVAVNDHDNDGHGNDWAVTPQAPSAKNKLQKIAPNTYTVAGLGEGVRVPAQGTNVRFDVNASGQWTEDARYVTNGDVLNLRRVDQNLAGELTVGGLLAINNWQLTLGNTQKFNVAVNTPPAISSGQAFAVDESDIFAVTVGKIIVTDVDGDALNFSLSGVNSDNFLVENDGTLKSKGPIDYEQTNSYTLTVVASDRVSNSTPENVHITVVNKPEINAGNEVVPGAGIGGGALHYLWFLLLLSAGAARQIGRSKARKKHAQLLSKKITGNVKKRFSFLALTLASVTLVTEANESDESTFKTFRGSESPISAGLGAGSDRTLTVNMQWNGDKQWGFYLGLVHKEAKDNCEHNAATYNKQQLPHCSSPLSSSDPELTFITDGYQFGGTWKFNEQWMVGGGFQQEIGKWKASDHNNLTIEQQALLNEPKEKSVGAFLFTEYRFHAHFGAQLQWNNIEPTLSVQIYF
jgi:uncharacterized delta-60 repeat protein